MWWLLCACGCAAALRSAVALEGREYHASSPVAPNYPNLTCGLLGKTCCGPNTGNCPCPSGGGGAGAPCGSYGNPANMPCQPDEIKMTLPHAPGYYFCAPPCSPTSKCPAVASDNISDIPFACDHPPCGVNYLPNVSASLFAVKSGCVIETKGHPHPNRCGLICDPTSPYPRKSCPGITAYPGPPALKIPYGAQFWEADCVKVETIGICMYKRY